MGRAEVGVKEGEASTSGCWRVGRPRAQLSWERPEHEGQLSSPLSLHAQSGPAQRAPDTGLLKVQWEELGRGLRRNWLGEVGVRMGVLWTQSFQKELRLEPRSGQGAEQTCSWPQNQNGVSPPGWEHFAHSESPAVCAAVGCRCGDPVAHMSSFRGYFPQGRGLAQALEGILLSCPVGEGLSVELGGSFVQ